MRLRPPAVILALSAALLWPPAWAESPTDASHLDQGHQEPSQEEHGREEHSQKEHGQEEHGHGSRLSDQPRPLQLEGFPERPKPLLELGENFLGTGTLDPGIELPTGAVWQPQLLLFGTLRTGVQSSERDGLQVSEAVARLDLFANLQLSGTERLVVGLRPFDQNGRFTSLIFDSEIPGLDDGFQDEFNATITSVFFEGDFGEIFPNLSRDDFSATDIGFSVGRQPLLFQEGLLINDSIDGLGLTRNTLQPAGTSNFRATLFWGWNEVGRGGGAGGRNDDASLYGLLTSTDFRRSTVDADLVWVTGDAGDLVVAGVSAVQRLGQLNTAFRVLASSASEETAVASDGALLFSEVSWTPHGGHDLAYVNAFWAVEDFSSAARGPDTGGPLGRAGINFAAVGLGSYGAALSSRAQRVAGGAVGYQKFFDGTRKQVLIELGGRVGTAAEVADSVAATVRYQSAHGRRWVVVADAFAGYRGATDLPGDLDTDLFGGRLELVLKF